PAGASGPSQQGAFKVKVHGNVTSNSDGGWSAQACHSGIELVGTSGTQIVRSLSTTALPSIEINSSSDVVFDGTVRLACSIRYVTALTVDYTGSTLYFSNNNTGVADMGTQVVNNVTVDKGGNG